jgi:hypothetical protein
MDLETLDEEENVPPAVASQRRLDRIAKKKTQLSSNLKSLNRQLKTLESEEGGLVDVGALTAEIGGDADLAEILEGIKLSEDEIQSLAEEIKKVEARRAELQEGGGDFKAQYANERRITKGIEVLLASQKVQYDEERVEIRELLEKLKEIKRDHLSETEQAISEALETPMQSAVSTLIGLIRTMADKVDMYSIAVPLAKVLKQVSAANVYTPKFNFNGEADTETQKWIAETFSPKVADRPTTRLERRRAGVTQSMTVLHERSMAAVDGMGRYTFDQFAFQEDELADLFVGAFSKFNIFEEFSVPMPVFRSFLTSMRAGYRSENPYHNYRHAFDVMQMLMAFLELTNATAYITSFDVFLLMVSAIGHDCDHNGLNNNFHINSQSPLAMLYNDQSVMESHHCSFTMKTLGKTESNLLANLTSEQLKDARSRMSDMILATDMANHFDVTNKFKVKADTAAFDADKAEDRQILCNLLLHGADLSNPVRPFGLAKKWAWSIIEEFSAQGDIEKKLNLPVSPMCDRDGLTTTMAKAKMQVGFGDFVIGPMYIQMASFFTGMQPCLDDLAVNRTIWNSIAAGEITMEQAVAEAEAKAKAALSPEPQPESDV